MMNWPAGRADEAVYRREGRRGGRLALGLAVAASPSEMCVNPIKRAICMCNNKNVVLLIKMRSGDCEIANCNKR